MAVRGVAVGGGVCWGGEGLLSGCGGRGVLGLGGVVIRLGPAQGLPYIIIATQVAGMCRKDSGRACCKCSHVCIVHSTFHVVLFRCSLLQYQYTSTAHPSISLESSWAAVGAKNKKTRSLRCTQMRASLKRTQCSSSATSPAQHVEPYEAVPDPHSLMKVTGVSNALVDGGWSRTGSPS